MSYRVKSILDPRRDGGQTDRLTDRRPMGSPHPLRLDYRNNFIRIILRTIYVRNMFWGRILVTFVPIGGNDRNIFTNVNAAPRLTHNRKFGHYAVLEGNVVCLVFIFLDDYIGQIYFS